jgi:hypothetical protein
MDFKIWFILSSQRLSHRDGTEDEIDGDSAEYVPADLVSQSYFIHKIWLQRRVSQQPRVKFINVLKKALRRVRLFHILAPHQQPEEPYRRSHTAVLSPEQQQDSLSHFGKNRRQGYVVLGVLRRKAFAQGLD